MQRVLGQVLLWSGFLCAALASVSQKEFDFLPDAEKVALARLPESGSITQKDLDGIQTTPVENLELAEFESLVDRLAPIFETKAELADIVNTLNSGPVTELSHEDLITLEGYLPTLKEAAKNREAAAAEKQRLLDEGQELAEESPEEIARKKRDSRSIDRNFLTNKRVQRIKNRWPTVKWLWYALSMLVGVAGVYLLRTSSKSAEQHQGRVEKEYDAIRENLATLNDRVGWLQSNLGELAPEQVVQFIDDECASAFSDFADARNALVQRFGLQGFADVMTQFASGERFVNRAWSAAADGYMNEAEDSINRAVAHLQKAAGLIEDLEAESVD